MIGASSAAGPAVSALCTKKPRQLVEKSVRSGLVADARARPVGSSINGTATARPIGDGHSRNLEVAKGAEPADWQSQGVPRRPREGRRPLSPERARA